MSADIQPLYPELPPGDFIRVLDLCPGTGAEELIGELRTCELGTSPYAALSYVCGDTALTHRISVSGHQLGVYKNAFELLTRFRHPTETVTVWIDVVCIYLDRSRIKYCRNLRIEPQFSEGFDFEDLVCPVFTHELAPRSWFGILYKGPFMIPSHSVESIHSNIPPFPGRSRDQGGIMIPFRRLNVAAL
jgi:Heterokaryon incompatibility protein (HET)